MNEMPPPRRIGRSIGAVLAGILVSAVLSIATDAVLHAIGVFPPLGQSMVGYEGVLLLATVYGTVYGVAGNVGAGNRNRRVERFHWREQALALKL